MKKQLLLQLFMLVAFLGITTNTNLFGQSFVLNGDFAEGLTTNWEHRVIEGNAPFAEENGALKAEIGTAPANWWETGIISLKKDNTFELGQTVRVTFKLETTDTDAKVKCIMHTPEIDVDNPAYSDAVDVVLESGSNVYTVDIKNTHVSRSNYEFNLFFLNSGTFIVDDIAVELVDLGPNLATSASVTTDATEGDITKINDGDITPWSGWGLTSVDAENPTPFWVEFTWDAPQNLNTVIVYTIDNVEYAVNGYAIQYWDGEAYQDFAVVSGNTESSVFSAVSATISTDKLRFIFTDPDETSAWYRVDEIEIYNDASITTAIKSVKPQEIKNVLSVYTIYNETVIEAQEDIQQLQIYSLNGSLVYNRSKSMGTKTHKISSSVFEPGMYLVVVNGINSQKFIVR